MIQRGCVWVLANHGELSKGCVVVLANHGVQSNEGSRVSKSRRTV
jgi:hypothetical protein